MLECKRKGKLTLCAGSTDIREIYFPTKILNAVVILLCFFVTCRKFEKKKKIPSNNTKQINGKSYFEKRIHVGREKVPFLLLLSS